MIRSESASIVLAASMRVLFFLSAMSFCLGALEVILNCDSPAPTRVVDGVLQPVAPTTAEQRLARKNKLKARGTLLMALPDKHQLKFNSHKDAKTLMEAIEKRFGGNTDTKKVQKTLLKQQYENFLGSSTESLDQIHDRLQKLISQLEILRVSLLQEDINLMFLRSRSSEWRTHTLIWRNKTNLEEQSLDDLFNSLKIYEAEVKSSSSASTTTQNIAFVSSSNTDSTTKPVSAAASVSAVSTKILVSPLPNIDADDLEEMDLTWQMAMLTVECYNCHRKGHFVRECRSPKDTRRNGVAEPQRRNVLVETSTSNALVSQCDGMRSYDWSFQAEEEPTNYALMDFSSLSSPSNNKLRDNALVSLRQNIEKPEQERDDLKLKLEKFQTSSKNLRELLASQTNAKTGSDESLPPSPIYDRYQSGNGYHVVSSPYTGTFMPPKPDLVFNNEPNAVKTCHPAFNVKLSPTEPDQDLSLTNRPSTPIIEDWVSNSEDESETKTPQNHVVPAAVLIQSKPVPINTVPINAVRPVSIVVPKIKASNSSPRDTAVKALVVNAAQGMQGKWEWRPKCLILNHVSRNTSASMTLKRFDYNDVLRRSKSGTCPIYLILRSSMVDTLPLVETQRVMCDKKNSVIFTDTEYLVLSPEFKLPDENQVLLRVLRENNMYNVNLKNLVPSRDLTCLFAKETIDESNLWHRRLGHSNFKTMNKFVKGKQHRASCKTKPVSFVDQPLYRLHMDLFGPTFVKSLNKKSYCLVVIDDYSRFTWVFFLATKDETSPILKTFITSLENQLSLKGIKREFSVPRTPQQNNIPERKYKTLIEAARTMLVDLLLPIPFWAETVNSACYVQNRVLVTKPHNKTPYELLHGKIPSIGFMRPFGCLVTILNTLDSLGSGTAWLFDIDTLTKTMNYQPVTADDAFDEKEHEFDEKKLEFEVNVSPSSRYRNLSAEFEDFSDDSINKVNPTDTSQLLDDPDMPELEDITYSNDEDNVGAEADFNNLETSITVSPIPTTRVHKDHPVTKIIGHTREEGIDYKEVFAPVARIEAIRLFLAYATFMGFMVYQMDVKSAFLYGTIEEEVYVYQLLGFEDPDYLDKVYKVVKIYVDDIIFGLINKDLCKSFEKLMKDKFQVSSIGELTFFLDLQVKQKKDGIFIRQDKYVDEILRKFGLTDGKLASTPIDTGKPLLKDPDGQTTAGKEISNPFMAGSLPKTMLLNFIPRHVVKSKFSTVSTNLDIASNSNDPPHLGVNTPRCDKFWTTVAVKKVNDVKRLQALVDKKKVVVTEATIRDVLRLDDEEGVKCLPNEEIFAELARMGYEKPSTKLMFYKAFFSS
uniref:Uncharacterized protein n=1 Tax=Tanacetum cinerariifolium TaxID=118510 RepID=A0A699GXJ1_TANCI|nr:hypothetical protein [Tanacetum cinerariifolium]